MKKAMVRRIVMSLALVPLLISVVAVWSSAETDKEIVLQPGDEIIVRIPVEPRFSGEYTVNQQGEFYFPILEGIDLGAFDVQGMRLKEVEDLIRQRIREYYVQDEVTVSLLSMGVRPGRAVSVMGAVNTPGNFSYYEGFTLVDAIIRSGNIREEADISNIVIHRKSSPTLNIDARNILNGTDMTNNIELRAGDYVVVPTMESHMKVKVVVLGQVDTPGTYQLPEGARVIDVISEAKGTIGRAGLGKSYVIRAVNGKPTVIHTDLKALIQRAELKENVEIMDGDIVFVPESSGFDIMNKVSDIISLNLLKNIIKDEF